MSYEFLKISTFWTALGGIVATALIGFLGARVTYRAARPKKRIIAQIIEQVVSPTENVVYATIVISNSGKRAITAADFYEDLPLELDLSTDVIRIDGVESRPRTQRAVPVRLCPGMPTVLNVGPGLLNQGQMIGIFTTLAAEGKLTLKGGLVDVELSTQKFGLAARHSSGVVLSLAGLTYSYLYTKYIAKSGYWESFQFWRSENWLSFSEWVNAFNVEPLGFWGSIACLLICGAAWSVFRQSSTE